VSLVYGYFWGNKSKTAAGNVDFTSYGEKRMAIFLPTNGLKGMFFIVLFGLE